MLSKTFLFVSSLLAIVILFNTPELHAQTITGVVVDARDGSPLAGAAVRQVGTSRGVSTQVDGSFEFTLTDGEAKELLITYLGYKDKAVDVSKKYREIRIYLEPTTFLSGEVFVEATRVDEATPFSYTNITREELEEENLGQDVPYLLRSAPSVTATSDAGTGIGYTGIRIRGVDPTRINVTINGIPVNDAESHGVFWVDLPDIISSTENLQIQRGVGTSTNGAGAFGGSINLQTSSNRVEPFAEINTGIGSFNTRKANILLGSGLMGNGWMFEGRLSKIMSDGFIDRASADLNSFYLSASKRGERSLLKADVFSGKEITYQAWYGVEQSVLEGGDRTFNEAGIGFDDPSTPQIEYYDNQVDNYRQDYYQLHYSYRFLDNLVGNASLHYTRGIGYYEEYEAGEDLADYGITTGTGIPDESDLIRRRWLDNHYYGGVFSLKYEGQDALDLTIGGGAHQYDGGHFGEVIWARFAGDSETEDRYYDNDGDKFDANLYVKGNYYFTDQLNAYVDLQGRIINYDFLGLDFENGNVVDIDDSDQLFFFNPKAGIVYRMNDNTRLYASLGVASKEPTRDEYVNSTADSRPEAETLYNVEAGYKGEFGSFYLGANGYAMLYDDQLVLTGQINDVGAYIRDNVDNSYRIGVELEGGVQLTQNLGWSANVTLSQNKIEEISEFIDDYDNGGQVERTFTDTDIAFSPNFIGNSIFNYTVDGFSAELWSKYVSRQYLDNTQNENRSIDPYFVNDLNLSYSLTNIEFANAVTATLRIANLLDVNYETNGYTFGFIAGGEQRFNYYYPQAGRNFLLQVKWEF